MFSFHRPNAFSLSLAFALALSTSLSAAATRTWTSAKNGKTLEAEFVAMTETSVVVLTADGKKRTLPLDFLIEEDRAEAKKLQDAADGYGEVERPELADDDGPVTLVLSGFHLCCNVAKEQILAAAGSAGAVAKIEDRLSQAVLTAPSSAVAQQAIDAIAKAGFYGAIGAKGGDTKVQFYTGQRRPETVQSATFALGNPICCERAADDLARAIKDVRGAKKVTPSVGAYDIKIEGEFEPREILESFQTVGYQATLR